MGVKLSITLISFFLLLASIANAADFDITTFGAKGDGGTESGPALEKAFAAACAAPAASKVVVPKGTFAVSQAVFKGPCKAPITLLLQGTLKAPADAAATKEPNWITFDYLDHLTVMGGGIFDGNGQAAWSRKDCTKTNYCAKLPVNVAFNYITNSIVQDVTNQNSKQFHTVVLGGKNFTFQHYTVNAPETSLNTDGIHVGKSDGVYIYDSHVKTGDDCFSIGDGSKNIHIEGSSCGPGHGISIGSLGRYKNEEPVVGIFVKHCTISNAQNGVRIKTWPNSEPGTASDIHFEDIIMEKVDNPILIDQVYCPWNQCTASIPSRVKLSNISFRNIRGTSGLQQAVKLSCSKAFPCDQVELTDIDLTHPAGAVSVCSNVSPKLGGKQNPKACTAPAV